MGVFVTGLLVHGWKRRKSKTISPVGFLVPGLLVHGWERRQLNWRKEEVELSPVGVLQRFTFAWVKGSISYCEHAGIHEHPRDSDIHGPRDHKRMRFTNSLLANQYTAIQFSIRSFRT